MRHSGLFLDSLVEGDPAAAAVARRNRVVSMCLSVLTQIVLLAVALVIPLVVTAERLKPVQVTPSPPYYPGRNRPTPPAGTRTPTVRTQHVPVFRPGVPIFQPTRIPTHVADIHDEASVTLPLGAIEIPGGSNGRGVIPGVPDFFEGRPQAPLPEPPAKNPAAPLKRSEGVQQALLIYRVTPEYPLWAQRARIEGAVVLRAIIGRDGTIRELNILEGNPLLARAAVEAVQQWRYQPTLLSGVPMEVDTLVTVIFKVQR